MAKQTLTTIKDEHFGIARKIVSNMTAESWETIPHCCATYDAEVTEFMRVLKEINSTISKEEKITVNTAMLRVIVEAIKACPQVNSHIYFNRKLVRGEVKTFKEINISMPTVLHNGEMMTLNIHDMDKKSMSQMRDTIKETIRRANNTDLNEVMFEVSLDNTLTGLKQGKIAQTICRLVGSKTGKHKVKTLKGEAKKKYYSIPESDRLTKHDIEQGTITVSNLGSICRDWQGVCTLLEIIPPQTCAIAIGSIQKKPVCDENGNVVAGNVMPLTLAFDHRAIDLGDVKPFITKLNEIFKNPEVMKEWL